MERSREYDDISTALAELRPEPGPNFAAELDALVAAGFKSSSRRQRSPMAHLATRFRALSSQRLLFTSGAGALAVIAIATVVVTSVDSGSTPVAFEQHAAFERRVAKPSAQLDKGLPRSSNRSLESSAASAEVGAEPLPGSLREYSSSFRNPNASFTPTRTTRHRNIERSAQIGLLAEPSDVADDSSKVFAAVHDADGIVLHSTTSSGSNAGARFALLIPSARLGDALAAISSIDEVSSRHEATDDITAPTVSTREELQDSRARIDTLLAQLSAAETEAEAEAVDAELRGERRHAAELRARLARLDRRTTYSHVSVRIESDPSADSGGAWGFDDAIGDAGRILAVAAAVTLVGLAIAAPIALIALLAWLAHRLWLRTRRERALDA
jgi:hypothetical protein